MSLPFGAQAGERLVPPTPVKVDHAAEDEREHANLKAVVAKRGEGETAVVGRDARRERDGAEVSDGMLVGAVVVHLPDLFVGACRA